RLDSAAAIAKALLAADLDVFHVSGSSLGDTAMAGRLLELCERLHAAGVALSFDPNVRKELAGEPAYRRTVDALIRRSRYFLPSEEDAAALFPDEAFPDFAA